MKRILLLASTFLAAAGTLLAQTLEVTSTGLGLGTSTPGYLLDVEGGSAVLDGTHGGVYTSADQSPFTATGVLLRGKGSTPSVVAQTGTATSGSAFAVYNSTPAALLWVGGNGNVGVNTTSPLSPLHVMGVGRFGLNNTGINNIGGILVASGTGAGGARQYWIGASDPTAHNNNMFEISDYNGTTNSPLLTIYGMHAGASGGFVGIGTTTPGYKLEVAGSVRATSFISNSGTYADFVFKPGYQLRSLAEVEAAIARDGHLPDIPSEAEAKAHGIDLAAQQVKLLQKVEELTLYAIEHQKELAQLRAENAALKEKIAVLAAP